MEKEEKRNQEGMEIANSSEQGDTRHDSTKNSALPTDSMVTVRLSDASITPASTDLDKNVTVAVTLAEDDSTIQYPTISTPNEEGALDAVEASEDASSETTMQHRQSSASMDSFPEDASSSTVRSRSDSSGTLSSTNSAQVDWLELEKVEEQAPRDEGSDEVGGFLCAIHRDAD